MRNPRDIEYSIARNPWEWELPPGRPRPPAPPEKKRKQTSAEKLCLHLLKALSVPSELHETMMQAPVVFENWWEDEAKARAEREKQLQADRDLELHEQKRWLRERIRDDLWGDETSYRTRIMGEFPHPDEYPGGRGRVVGRTLRVDHDGVIRQEIEVEFPDRQEAPLYPRGF